MNRKRFALAFVLLISMSGCTAIDDYFGDMHLRMRCGNAARWAWRRDCDMYQDVDNLYHFGIGYKAGYCAMCTSGNSCPPAIPPESYWRTWGDMDECRTDVLAWYNGYAHGVLAAEQDGMNGWSRITSPVLQEQAAARKQSRMRAGRGAAAGAAVPGMEPMPANAPGVDDGGPLGPGKVPVADPIDEVVPPAGAPVYEGAQADEFFAPK